MKKAAFFIGGGLVIIVVIVAIIGFRSQSADQNMQESKQASEKVLIPEVRVFEHDQDRDGILDEEEAQLGTSDTEFDTDGDTIPDSMEIDTYGTDPLNPDTDGDGFWDAYEIINGYNPKGQGRI